MAKKINDPELLDEEKLNFYIELFTAIDILSKSMQSIRRRLISTRDADEYNELRSEQMPWLKMQSDILTRQQFYFENSSLAITPPTDEQIREIERLAEEVSILQRNQELYSSAINASTRAVALYNSTQPKES